MEKRTQFFIDGRWIEPVSSQTLEVINPATEEPIAVISIGSANDVDFAVKAARQAFESWSQTSLTDRVDLVRRFATVYESHIEDMAQTISEEMGAPITHARTQQASAALFHINGFLATLEEFSFSETVRDQSTISLCSKVPIGVCGLITPWNWPMSQVSLKAIPAILAGCTVVLKPSERAPLSSMLFAELLNEAGCPPGIFNLVNGDGILTGSALTSHPDVAMISFTGSTRAGITISAAASETVKRVSLELGGKSPNIVFADVDIDKVVRQQMELILDNTGQNCNAPSRLLVERSVYEPVVNLASELAEKASVDIPSKEGNHIGPLASKMQFDKVQQLIETGIEEDIRLVAGGTGRPLGLNRGYFVRPTVFADVDNAMTIAREEVFGPVLCILPFDTEQEAIDLANDTPYGLAAYVQTHDDSRLQRVARAIRVGMVQVNGAGRAAVSPFGGMKLSGTAREGGKWGLEEYLITKCVSSPSFADN